MKVAVVKERRTFERRVAASPDTVKHMVGLGLEVVVESGAGGGAFFPDAVYESAGATIAADEAATLDGADLVLKVQRPLLGDGDGLDELSLMKRGAALVGLLAPLEHPAEVEAYARAGISAIAMELVPRITRAQAMDVLSSQANLAGYKAAVDAAAEFGRAMPMMMTAAGTIKAARVLVMGAGVAGLQAIATARRLGAVVTATDVRPAAKEQVESLGAKFVAVEDEEFKAAETAAGYAKPMSAEYQAKQAALVGEHIKRQDIVITTALIPGRPAPRLVTAEQVASMRPGSVIVDLAVEQGGNVEGAKAGEVVETGGVKIVGYSNMPGRIAADSSALYARNLVAFAGLLLNAEGQLEPDFEDEILKAALVVKDGAIVHPALKG